MKTSKKVKVLTLSPKSLRDMSDAALLAVIGGARNY